MSDVDPTNRTGTCSECGPVKVYSSGTYKGQAVFRCSLPALTDANQRYQDDPLAYLNARLIREYDLSPGQYDEMLESQGGVCLRCQKPPITMRLAVDHSHETGEVRGLLCGSCNTYLGRLEANLARLAEDLRYLNNPAMMAIPFV